MSSQPSLPPYREFGKLIDTPTKAINFLKTNGILNEEVFCDYGSRMIWTWPPSWKYPKWRCVYSCRCKRSSKAVTTGSYFFNRKANLEAILWVLHGFVARNSLYALSIGNRLDRRTVSQIIFDIYQVMNDDILDEDITLGGPDIIEVQIDESKFGKRKNNRGQRVEGVWVFGMVEKKANGRAGKVFMSIVPDRKADTLIPLIQQYIVPGTRVISDCHGPYMRLRNLGFDHIAVNHSIGFATTNNSIGHTNGNELFNTNMIEGMWTAVKHAVPRRHRTVSNCPWKLLEFLWRRKHSNHWTSLLQGLASTEFSTRNNNHYTEDIINNLPTRVPGDYSQYEYQEDNQLIEFVDLPDAYSSDSDSSTESESDNHSEFTPPPAQHRRTN